MLDKTQVQYGDFFMDDEGVFYNDPRGQQETIHVCSPLVLTATTRNADGNDWGKLFTLTDPAGVEKQYHMRNAAGTAIAITDLKHKGLMMSAHTRAHALLAHYLIFRQNRTADVVQRQVGLGGRQQLRVA